MALLKDFLRSNGLQILLLINLRLKLISKILKIFSYKWNYKSRPINSIPACKAIKTAPG